MLPIERAAIRLDASRRVAALPEIRETSGDHGNAFFASSDFNLIRASTVYLRERLFDYRWSSYQFYVSLPGRPDWSSQSYFASGFGDCIEACPIT